MITRQASSARRERLVARSGRLRRDLREELGTLTGPLQFADRVIAVGRSPWAQTLLGAGAALLLLKRPRRLVRIGLKLAAFYPALRPAATFVKSLWNARRRPAAECEGEPPPAPDMPPPYVPPYLVPP